MSHKCHSRAAIPAAVLFVCSPALWAAEGGAASTADAANKLEVVKVEGTRQPYKTLSATGAMKTDTPVRDMAQSVRVLSADILEDAGITKLADALDLGSGISKQSNLGGLWDSYAMRGFTGDPNFGSDYMVNGFNYSRGYNGVRDSANTASVEVLKGPASALYGRGEPGGTVNITTKKPLFVPEYTLGLSGGSYSTFRQTADLTGPISSEIAYRLNAAHEKGDSYRDYVKSERTLVSPSFLWMLGQDTTVSYELEYSKQEASFDRGVVAINGKLDVVPRSRYFGEPNDGLHTIKTTGNQLFVQHYFNDDWSIQTGVSYRESSIKGISTEVGAFKSGSTSIVNRMRRTRDNHALDVSGRFELLGKVRAAGMQHNLLFGVDAYKFSDNRLQFRVRNVPALELDIYNPVYGNPPPAFPATPLTWTHEEQRSKSVYAQDQIDLSAQWKLLLGVRYDKYDQSMLNHNSSKTVEQSLSATSPRAGLVYQPSKTVSLYVTASKSFRPNSGVSRAFESFPAEKGKSAEVGAKYDSADGKISGTLAIYNISKNNVLTPDPLDPNNFSVAAGEVQSKGVELDLGGEIAAGLRLSAAYAFTDAKVTQDNNNFLVGRQLANVPRHSANLMLVQAFKLGGNAATAGVGLNYIGEREGAVAPLVATDDFKLPAYTSVKLIGSYAIGKAWKFSLDVDNLFDKTFYSSSYSQMWVFPGNGRKFTLSGQYKF
ncbi:MAG TPA: TonB-dependent siderophore receptor [Roseateles sp.]|uniref:TonB-dependent siderophore receptor n=1 Tax=Roseateles sp. TaxID=1971397 RepID=UPI002ED81A58